MNRCAPYLTSVNVYLAMSPLRNCNMIPGFAAMHNDLSAARLANLYQMYVPLSILSHT